jgi:tousled-like kinase
MHSLPLYRLKRQKILPEKDARAILLQILCGLRYLHRPLNYSGLFIDHPSGSTGQNNEAGGDAQQQAINKRRSIIHYDLKPANILFDEMGDVKITGK